MNKADLKRNLEAELLKIQRQNKFWATGETRYDLMIKDVLNYIYNSISKEVIEKKIEELNNGIKEDMKNYDKVKDESWKLAIHRSMRQKIETKKVLQELLEVK